MCLQRRNQQNAVHLISFVEVAQRPNLVHWMLKLISQIYYIFTYNNLLTNTGTIEVHLSSDIKHLFFIISSLYHFICPFLEVDKLLRAKILTAALWSDLSVQNS